MSEYLDITAAGTVMVSAQCFRQRIPVDFLQSSQKISLITMTPVDVTSYYPEHGDFGQRFHTLEKEVYSMPLRIAMVACCDKPRFAIGDSGLLDAVKRSHTDGEGEIVQVHGHLCPLLTWPSILESMKDSVMVMDWVRAKLTLSAFVAPQWQHIGKLSDGPTLYDAPMLTANAR